MNQYTCPKHGKLESIAIRTADEVEVCPIYKEPATHVVKEISEEEYRSDEIK